MASFVSIGSVSRQASLNYRRQRAAIFIDRKYVMFILGVSSENATSEARQSVNEKTTEMECFMFQTLTTGAPALKNIFSRAIRNSAILLHFRVPFRLPETSFL
jgi:hypothetical protein